MGLLKLTFVPQRKRLGYKNLRRPLILILTRSCWFYRTPRYGLKLSAVSLRFLEVPLCKVIPPFESEWPVSCLSCAPVMLPGCTSKATAPP